MFSTFYTVVRTDHVSGLWRGLVPVSKLSTNYIACLLICFEVMPEFDPNFTKTVDYIAICKQNN
jgi:hypothetical protein